MWVAHPYASYDHRTTSLRLVGRDQASYWSAVVGSPTLASRGCHGRVSWLHDFQRAAAISRTQMTVGSSERGRIVFRHWTSATSRTPCCGCRWKRCSGSATASERQREE